MIEIPSPSQTYDGATLVIASEWRSSTLLIPKSREWRIQASISASLYGDAAIEVVTLIKRRYYSGTADATYMLWTTPDGKPCPIENLCDECKGHGRNRDIFDREWLDCPYCEGRGWFYED